MTLTQKIQQALAMMFGGGAQLSNRNLIVDGNKDSWTQLTALSLSTTGQYTPNTLLAGRAGAGGVATYTAAPWSGAPGNPTMWGMQQPAKYYGSFQQTTASAGTHAARTTPGLWAPIEDVQTCEGQSFTLSLWLWATAPITLTKVIFDQNFGTGGSPSATVLNDVTVNWNLTTTPQRFSVRIDVPSIIGKTLGTTTPGYTQVGVLFPPGVTFAINDGQWQLEKSSPQSSSDLNGKGGTPTAFEYRGFQAELARVLRFYETGVYSFSAGFTANGAQHGGTTQFQQPKRASPAMSGANQSAGGVATTVNFSISVTGIFIWHSTNAASGTGGFTDTWTADARL
jgi:hypothetical protein